MASAAISKIESLGSIPGRGTIKDIEMIIMSKEEVKDASRTWAANVKAPIDRDNQIYMMKTAAWRHKQLQNKYKELFAKKGNNMGDNT